MKCNKVLVRGTFGMHLFCNKESVLGPVYLDYADYISSDACYACEEHKSELLNLKEKEIKPPSSVETS